MRNMSVDLILRKRHGRNKINKTIYGDTEIKGYKASLVSLVRVTQYASNISRENRTSELILL